MSTQIQLKTVKTVEIEPESAVPLPSNVGGIVDLPRLPVCQCAPGQHGGGRGGFGCARGRIAAVSVRPILHKQHGECKPAAGGHCPPVARGGPRDVISMTGCVRVTPARERAAEQHCVDGGAGSFGGARAIRGGPMACACDGGGWDRTGMKAVGLSCGWVLSLGALSRARLSSPCRAFPGWTTTGSDAAGMWNTRRPRSAGKARHARYERGEGLQSRTTPSTFFKLGRRGGGWWGSGLSEGSGTGRCDIDSHTALPPLPNPARTHPQTP